MRQGRAGVYGLVGAVAGLPVATGPGFVYDLTKSATLNLLRSGQI